MVWISLCFACLLVVAGTVEIALRATHLLIAAGRYPARPAACVGGVACDTTPFVSVHVPTCNEPPAMVIATLQSLSRSMFDRFEVIVVDNNTADPALWMPVEQAVRQLGPKFRFIRVAKLAGAKAGALNIALGAADPATTHIAVVDADYQVDPTFLGDSLAAATANGADYVQFPQAYRAVGRSARGVERELGDYFACFMSRAGQAGSMLPTGTLSLFAIEALRAVGGWPTRTITEDAEIGLRLQAAGYRGLWIGRECGRGLLPLDLDGIKKQRARWSAGNCQVLGQLWQVMGRPRHTPDLLGLVIQLTAWITLILPAAIALAVVGLFPHVPLAGPIGVIAAATILGSSLLSALRLFAFGDRAASWRVRIEAIATKSALTWTSATAWLPALLPVHLQFHRTAKSATDARADRLRASFAISVLFFALAVAQAAYGSALPALACLALASVWPCERFVDGALRRAAVPG